MLKYLLVWYERERSAVSEAETLISEFGRLAGPVAWFRAREAGLDREARILRRMVARDVRRILMRNPERAASLVVDRERLARLPVSKAAQEIAAAGSGLDGAALLHPRPGPDGGARLEPPEERRDAAYGRSRPAV
jgi:hypothetical protein